VGLPELIRYWHAGCKFWAATLGVCSSQVKDLGIWIVARDVERWQRFGTHRSRMDY
jgi:hypothetical protein